MNRKIYLLFSLILVLILATGCNSENKALEQGEEALANEKLEEAKGYFKTAVEKGNNEKAKEYLQVIELAGQFVKATESEDFDQSIELLESLKEHSLYSTIQFYTNDSEDLVQEVITQRQKIDNELEVLNDFFRADDGKFIPSDQYFEKLDQLLNEKYISEEQIEKVNTMRDAAEQKLDEVNNNQSNSNHNNNSGDSSNSSDSNNPENKDEEKQPVTSQPENNDKENNEGTPPADDTENTESNEDNHTKLSVEEAQKLVYDHLAQEYSADFLEGSNMNINYDHEDNGKYFFQFFEVMDGRTQTIGWYSVDQKTKAVSEAFN